MNLKSALRLNLDEMLKMKRKDLEDVWRTVNKTVSGRVSTFQKHDAMNALPKNIQKRPRSPRSFKNKRELIRSIADQQIFLFGERSSYTKYKEEEKRLRDLLKVRMGLDLKSGKQLARYGRFMNDVKKRFPDLMKKGSEPAVRLYKAVTRLGMNASLKTFTTNFDYWLDHLEDLENVPESEIIRDHKGAYASVSSYMDSLGLPPIRDYYDV